MREGQPSFTDVECGNRRRVSRRERFLETMDATVPWAVWVGLIEPFYFDGKKGRSPKPLETMLRMYLLQVWFSLSDEGADEAIYDSYAMAGPDRAEETRKASVRAKVEHPFLVVKRDFGFTKTPLGSTTSPG